MYSGDFDLIPRELLRAARPQRLILYALADWIVIAVIWIVALRTPWWFYPLWVTLLAGRFHALGVVLHDAVHIPKRGKCGAVRTVELLTGYPVGSTLEAMRYHHLRHHRDLGFPGDPYLKPWVGRSAIRHWLLSFRYFLLTPLWVMRGLYGTIAFHVPALRNSYGRWFLQDYSGDDLTSHTEVIACAREEHLQLLFYACVATLAAIWPGWVLGFYIVPLVLAGYLAVHITQHVLVPHFHYGEETHRVSAVTGFTALAGLSLHTFFDGVAIASGFLASGRLGLLLFLAVLVHKLPEGVTIASMMLASGQSKGRAVASAGGLGLATLLGAALTEVVGPLARHGLALSAGVTLYVAASNLVPEFQNRHRWVSAIAFFGGLAAFLVSDWLISAWLG